MGPGISGAVGVAADGAKHRADVQAGAAANAMQHLALLDVGEQFGFGRCRAERRGIPRGPSTSFGLRGPPISVL